MFQTDILARLDRIDATLCRVLTGINSLLNKDAVIMAALDTLTQDVATESGVVQSAVTLVNGLAQQIKDAGTDPAQLKALTDQMEANAKTLADAVAANTPAQAAS